MQRFCGDFKNALKMRKFNFSGVLHVPAPVDENSWFLSTSFVVGVCLRSCCFASIWPGE